jgi:FkbM family methyltransferase
MIGRNKSIRKMISGIKGIFGIKDSAKSIVDKDGKIRRVPTMLDSLQTISSFGIQIGTVVDVGVLHGTDALMKTFPDIKHVLFEPVPDVHNGIQESYRKFDYELVRAAASNKDGKSSLKLISSDVVSSNGRVTNSQLVNENSENCVTVDTIALDSFFRDKSYEEPFLLKIDVDGKEMLVLEGATETFYKTACIIIEATVEHFNERYKIISENDFFLWDIVDLNYTYGALWQVDLVFINNRYKDIVSRNPHGKIESKWARYH